MRKVLLILSLVVTFVIDINAGDWTVTDGGSSGGSSSYASMGCYDLWYARNSIYASKGYCFSSAKAVSIFGRRCFPPYGRLNSAESREVEIIKSWEARKGCSGQYVAPTPIQATVPPATATPVNNGNTILGYARVVNIRPYGFLAVRTGPGTGYAQIDSLHLGDSGLQVIRCLGRWCEVRYNNLVGWVYARYIQMY